VITEPLLLERLTMDDAAFAEFIASTIGGLAPRTFTPELLRRALGYPWERPRHSYLLADGEVLPLEKVDRVGRVPLLAIGSNGAPERLATKLAHLPSAERRVPVQAGQLHGFDVGAAAHPTLYGSMAATLFESPGTTVRAAVLWVTPVQFTQLSWTEITYRLGRLAPVDFTTDEGARVEEVWVYISRWGTFCPEGEPLALAAIPARDRTARACTQEELLTRAARLALGEAADAEQLVRTVFEAPGTLPGDRFVAAGRPFAPAAWRPFRPAG
jgi:hypothetical protein